MYFGICKIEEPIAKGIALGSASHAIGTAKAMELGEIEGAMSSLLDCSGGRTHCCRSIRICTVPINKREADCAYPL